MLPTLGTLCLLVVGVVRSDYGQGYQNNRQMETGGYNGNREINQRADGQGTGGYNNGYNNNREINQRADGQGLGQGYNNGYNGNVQSGLGQGYNNENQKAYPGVGQGGYNGNQPSYDKYSQPSYNQPADKYSQPSYNQQSSYNQPSYNNNNQGGYAGLGQNDKNGGYQGNGYSGLGNGNVNQPVDDDERIKNSALVQSFLNNKQGNLPEINRRDRRHSVNQADNQNVQSDSGFNQNVQSDGGNSPNVASSVNQRDRRHSHSVNQADNQNVQSDSGFNQNVRSGDDNSPNVASSVNQRSRRDINQPVNLNQKAENVNEPAETLNQAVNVNEPAETLNQAVNEASETLNQAVNEASETLNQAENVNEPASSLNEEVSINQEATPASLNEPANVNVRGKRYSEREPYRKTCNTYYGKYICYRLYERDAAIPNDFTCWQTYVGKKNCTETENILYLDRRNVEVDPDEGLDRRFYPNRDNDRQLPTLPTRSRQDRYRQSDDEFGAVEKNLHNQRHSDRRLPNEDY